MKKSPLKKIKKELESFMLDEAGYASKEKVLKIGIGTIAAIGILTEFAGDSFAGYSAHSVHSSSAGNTGSPARPYHSSGYAHTDHGSY